MTVIADSQKRTLILLTDKNGIDKVNLLREL